MADLPTALYVVTGSHHTRWRGIARSHGRTTRWCRGVSWMGRMVHYYSTHPHYLLPNIDHVITQNRFCTEEVHGEHDG